MSRRGGVLVYLLLCGLVGNLDVGEPLTTAGGVGHARHLQQTLALHGSDERSGGVPGCSAHLQRGGELEGGGTGRKKHLSEL